ncbi:MAG: response regulator [Polyangia bacterium]
MLDPINDRPLARRLFVALALPVALLLVVGVVLGLQISRMRDTARWVDQTDAVLAKAFEVQKRMLDQETGLRGYLITGDRVFLQPYETANVREALRELRGLLAEAPDLRLRVETVAARYEGWSSYSDRVVSGELPPVQARAVESMMLRKQHMDQVRAGIGELIEAEKRLRAERQESLRESSQATRVIFIGLLTLTALVLTLVSRRTLNVISRRFGTALDSERTARQRLELEQWIRTGQMRLKESIQGDLDVAEIAGRGLRALAEHTGAVVGALFVADRDGWRRVAGFGLDDKSAGPLRFARGEGLVGRAAESGVLTELTDVPPDYLRVRSGLGELAPRQILIAPAAADDVVHGLVELGFTKPVEPQVRELLKNVRVPLAIGVRSAEYRARLQELLEESQRQAEELQAQGEELRVANEELHEQSEALREAQRRLEERQTELEQSNTGLAAQTAELLRAKQALADKATELERASRYKSEFLANMSHELRTPLNSSLILARLLADNKHGNLDAEQVRYAETIYAAGNDLLTLINDILDLSKIEAGKVEVQPQATTLRRLVEPVMRGFEALARQKGLRLLAVYTDGVAEAIETDIQRVQQILKNLLSNALKFTDRGEVELRVEGDATEVRFAVRDTGIGIPPAQHELIFEAFRQADGTTHRRYGGTGLGLSISRDLAGLLGGSLGVVSQPGQGSTFTLRLPRAFRPRTDHPPADRPREDLPRPRSRPPATAGLMSPRPPSPSPSSVPVPVPVPVPARRQLLIVEDDPSFSRILFDLSRELDFEPVVADTADEAMRLAQLHVPAAVVLDMNLPDHSGLSVLERLKRDPRTRHIPVHVISVADLSQQALAMGAAGYLLKPVQRDQVIDALRSIEQRFIRRVRRILVVEDDEVQRQSLYSLLSGEGVEIVAVGTVGEALAQLRKGTFDCVVTDLVLPDASGDDLLQKMAEDENSPFPPVIVYTGRSLSAEEEQRLRRHSSSIIVKGARSPERLLDEVTLFLHQVESELPPDRQRLLKQARDREKIFEGRRILLAEDDVRNIFALSSILEPKGAKLVVARNGREALAALKKDAKIDLVLMDIMMPEMDGITAMREIRKRPELAKLPIIALTAKAMRDDQEACLAAGASDYAAKPIDVEMLLSLLRVWMPK